MNLEPVVRYYTEALARHGASARGVDWNSEESQRLRFDQLARLWEPGQPPGSLNDYGCGVGALCEHLRGRGWTGAYTGFDIAPAMIATASDRFAGDAAAQFVGQEGDLTIADVSVASGIFNVKLDADDGTWREYVERTLDRLREISRSAFAFNVLSTWSDPERRRDYLFYADPADMLSYCQRRFSRHVALLHDYPLYEFTMLVRVPE